MPGAGDLPHRQRMPSIKHDVLVWRSDGSQDQEQCYYRDRLGRDKHQLDRRHGLAKAGRYEKHHLCDRRVDRRRVIAPVDIRKDGLIAQRRQGRVGRYVPVWVDAGSLDAAIPNVPVDVVREIDGCSERPETHQGGGHQDQREGWTSDAARNEDCSDGPDRTLEQRSDDEAGEVVVELREETKSLARKQQQGEQQKPQCFSSREAQESAPPRRFPC